MAQPSSFDKINKIEREQKPKAIPYEQYFGEMELTDEQKEKRITIANELEKVFVLLLALIELDLSLKNDLDIYFYTQYAENRFVGVLSALGYDLTGEQEYLNAYIVATVTEIVDTTIRNQSNDWYLSQDRAMLIAENEANAIANNEELQEAIENGFTRKTWHTMRDRKVRHTHEMVDDLTIGIYDFFEVGDSLMLYPKDQSQGADMSEIANCRCSLTYSR